MTVAQPGGWVVALGRTRVLTDLIRVMSERSLLVAVVVDEQSRQVLGLASAERINAVVGAELARGASADAGAVAVVPHLGQPTEPWSTAVDGSAGRGRGILGPRGRVRKERSDAPDGRDTDVHARPQGQPALRTR